jgi:Fe2+ or Zn2+ uptake regulation protein
MKQQTIFFPFPFGMKIRSKLNFIYCQGVGNETSFFCTLWPKSTGEQHTHFTCAACGDATEEKSGMSFF